MSFEKELPVWNSPGLKPSQNKIDEGWKESEKPPAEWFNWFQHTTYQALKEVREHISAFERSIDTKDEQTDARYRIGFENGRLFFEEVND
ncbi:hypothetical protein [Desertibacillus haloalkaliphilus]|uniref:hypothetical protein n=1 Tax=Desertibacillus haloalkaliphilus TaxID=1328930 RepID=UPI001C26BEC9|nr:hypothetical protein [Desertibacillus haloalkaliphilus]MBU8908493.1 hypothetical protein [Desertibacillus haloalkaliphilus]